MKSMNVLLQTLEREGDVARPAEARVGKVLPARLTDRGRRHLAAATAAVRSVEVRMLADMTADEQNAARQMLRGMISRLRDDDDPLAGDAPTPHPERGSASAAH
jgi:DNA-binding MarR family transcriptional regulator